MTPLAPRDRDSAAERKSDHLIHIVGVALAVPALITMAVLKRGDWISIGAIAVYSLCLLGMLGASAIYNISDGSPWSPIYKRLDHSAIYFKIAGTFTPLVVLSGAGGLPLLIGLWTAALGGTSLKVMAPDRLRWLGLALYVGMGWIGVLAGGDLLGALSPSAMRLVVIGGTIYTVGVIFFLWEGLPFHTTIWHVFVLVATALLYLAILIEVLREIEPPVI